MRGLTLWILAAAFLVIPAPGAAQQEGSSAGDPEYTKTLQEDSGNKAQIEKVDALLSGDEELEESYLAYEDSLDAHAELRGYEDGLFEAADRDTMLARLMADYEEIEASTSEASERSADMDSILAADPGLADRMRQLEVMAAEDPDLLDDYGDQMFYLWSRPIEAEEFFSTDENGPYYPGSDEEIVTFVYYLEKHPRLFRAYWNLYTYVGANVPLKRALYSHWRWYMNRGDLWKAHWRYTLWTARNDGLHGLVWNRRLYLGRRPWLDRSIRAHHVLVVRRPHARPLLWKHGAFVARHPEHRSTVVKHRRWVKTHGPHPKAKPARTHMKPKPKAKSPGKTGR